MAATLVIVSCLNWDENFLSVTSLESDWRWLNWNKNLVLSRRLVAHLRQDLNDVTIKVGWNGNWLRSTGDYNICRHWLTLDHRDGVSLLLHLLAGNCRVSSDGSLLGGQ